MNKLKIEKHQKHYIMVIIFCIIFLYLGNYITTNNNPYFAGEMKGEIYYKAKVVDITNTSFVTEELGGVSYEYRLETLHVKLLEGVMKGDTVTVDIKTDLNIMPKPYPYEKGGKLLVTFNFDEQDNVIWYAADHVREGGIIGLIAVFLVLLIAFGRKKGFNTVVSLVFTTVSIFLVMLPAIIKGYNIYLVTVIISIFIVVMTLDIVSGINSKSISAAIGCIGGVMVAGIITVVMQNIMKITGLIDEDSSFVMFINPQSPIDLKGLIFAAIVIGALGAVMDVAMSIASSLDEILIHKPDLSVAEIVKSGLNIGRDIMGTMANTLILAYVGSSLHIILLLLAYNSSIGAVINRERIAVEVLQAVAGSLGILFTVPITTFVTAFFHKRVIPKTETEIE